jgi:hypothetical protein
MFSGIVDCPATACSGSEGLIVNQLRGYPKSRETRAVLFASLVDDPDSDPHYLKPNGSLDKEAAGIKRADLFNLIEELVMWENSNNPQVIRTARAEIARCVASRLIETGVLKKDAEVGVPASAGNGLMRPRRTMGWSLPGPS